MRSRVRSAVLLAFMAATAFASASAFCSNRGAMPTRRSGKDLANTCLGCHGVPGYKNAYPNYSVPKLEGQHPEYIVMALQAYRSGERSHLTMHSQASSLSDQDMTDIAAYFSGLVVEQGQQPARRQGAGLPRRSALRAMARTAWASLRSTRRSLASMPTTWSTPCSTTARAVARTPIMGTFAASDQRRGHQGPGEVLRTAEAHARDGNPTELDSDHERQALRFR